MIFVTLTAYAFSRYRFVGRKYGLITFLIFTNVPCINGNGRNLYFAKYNWIIRFFIWTNTGIYWWINTDECLFSERLLGITIPKELDESAKIDGAGHMRIFLQIMLPLAKPILAVVALFNFMGPFMDFILPKILLRSPEKFTLAVGLFNFINDKYANNFTVFAAGAIMIAVPIAIVFLFLQRYLVSGLTTGATKG